MKRKMMVVVLCVMIGCFAATNCLAEDAATFYKDNTITVIIPSSPGGGFDLTSRVIAPYLEKYTGANLLLQNSKQILSANLVYRAKPDGLTVLLSGHGPKEITAQLFKMEGVSYDWKKFTLLGRLPFSTTAMVVDKRLGWTKPSDLQGKRIFQGASSPFFGPLFAEALGWNQMYVVPGMSGGDRVMGLRRGEIQVTAAGAGQVAQNEDIMMAIVATNKDPKGFPGVPTVIDVAIPEKKKWAELTAAWDQLVYWSYTTPGIPQDRYDFLEKALEQTFNDAGFANDLKKIKMELSDHFVSGKELKEITRVISELTDDEIKEMQFVIQEKYLKK